MVSSKNTPATKADLEKLHSNIKREIKELHGEFNDLRGEFNGLRGEFTGLRGEFHQLRDDLKDEFDSFRKEVKNDTLTFKDQILTELKIIRENQEAHFGSHQRIEETIEGHEERITTLEQRPL